MMMMMNTLFHVGHKNLVVQTNKQTKKTKKQKKL